jgi:hypothetical protein
VILSGEAIQVFVEGGNSTIEILTVVVLGDGLFSPSAARCHFRERRRRAASIRARVGLGGFSRRSNTRSVSRSERMMRSALSTTSRAAGRTRPMMKLVTSSRSCAAAATRSRFSSLVALSSIRSLRAVDDAISLSIQGPVYRTDNGRATARTLSVQALTRIVSEPVRRAVPRVVLSSTDGPRPPRP